MVSLRQFEVLNCSLEGLSCLNQEGTRPQRMSMRTRSEESASFQMNKHLRSEQHHRDHKHPHSLREVFWKVLWKWLCPLKEGIWPASLPRDKLELTAPPSQAMQK